MQGQILEASAAKSGTILGDDGNRYAFTAADWRVGDAPVPGSRVDFVPGDGSTAREIFPLPGAAAGAATAAPAMAANVPPPSYPPRPLQNNSQLLGWIGIACLILGFILPIILPTIAAMILGLVGADSAKRHNDSTGLVVSRIAWIGAVVTMALGALLLVWALAFAWPFFAAIFEWAVEAERTGPGTNALIAWITR
jgi:hypothetical protein